MEKIEEQYQIIIETYPKTIIINNLITHVKIPINNGNFIEIDYKNYPKKPKVRLINKKGQVYKRLEKSIPTLNSWNAKNSPLIIELISQIRAFINNLSLKEVIIKKELLEGILGLCREHHPKEILGLLRVEREIVTEFILPPGALNSTISGVFFPNRIPYDLSLQGSVHSHPSGNPNPSSQDLNSVFKKMRFNFIIGYPYNLFNMKCFDRDGKEINYRIID